MLLQWLLLLLLQLLLLLWVVVVVRWCRRSSEITAIITKITG